MTRSNIEDMWSLAGLTNADGNLERLVSTDKIIKPINLWIENDELRWETPKDHLFSNFEEVSPSPGLLGQFVKLADASSDKVLRYAQKWGPLYICEHNLPTSHNPMKRYLPHTIESSCFPRVSKNGDYNWEPLAVWRHFTLQARSFLNIYARLANDEVGMAEDWRNVYKLSGKVAPWWKPSVGSELMLIERCINEWLFLADARIELGFRDWKPRVKFGTGSLFCALAIQLLLAINRTDGLAICSACSTSFTPSRKPRPGQRTYCRRCGRKAAMRDAARDYRQSKKNGKTGKSGRR